MAIDSAQKRMSIFQLPGLMTNPFPAGAITASDRQQISDVYIGIPAALPVVPPSQTCWVDATKGSTGWKNPSSLSSVWHNAIGNSTSWKNPSSGSSPWTDEKTLPSIWTEEKEVTPC